MTFVLVAGAEPADEHLALAAAELLQVLVLGADLLGQIACGRDELMLIQGLLRLVRLQVGFAVGAHTHQAALHCCSLLSFAHVTWHCRGGQLPFGFGFRGGSPTGAPHRLTHIRNMDSLAKLLHSISQHSVPGKGGLRAEGLAALGAAVDPFGVVFGPVILDAAHAVTVPTGDGNWIIGEVQAHGAVKLLLCPQLTTHGGNVRQNQRKNKM